MTLSPLFAVYRVATAVVEPGGAAFLGWRSRRGKEDPLRLGERLGRPGQHRPPGPLVWLHGASVGEGVSLLPLIDALLGRGCHVLLTTGTVNAARVLMGRLPAGVTHQFVPLDLPRAVQRFLRHWRPDLAVLAESELWPNLVHGLDLAGIPLVLVNARMSETSARRWARASGFIGGLLGRTALCLCQTVEDAERFTRLGAARVVVSGHLKFDVPPPAAEPASASDFVGGVGGRPVWIAASTHVDEEGALIEAHLLLRRDLGDALAVLVPRQPARGAALREEARRRGIPAALRSRGEPLDDTTVLYIADTLGELGLFYRTADVVFMGKSLVAPGGGQNPIEPAKLGCAVLHGLHIGNFADIFAALDTAGGAAPVADPTELADALTVLLSDPARLRLMARAAADVIDERAGATARVMASLEPFLSGVT